MGFVPDHWGPYVWAAIHIMCMGAPDKIPEGKRKSYAQFINSLPNILPCTVCGEHLRENLATFPVDDFLDSRQSLFEWSVRMHNIVNRHTGKQDVSFEDAFNHWKRICLGEDKDCKYTNRTYYMYVTFVIFVGIATAVLVWVCMAQQKGARC